MGRRFVADVGLGYLISRGKHKETMDPQYKHSQAMAIDSLARKEVNHGNPQ